MWTNRFRPITQHLFGGQMKSTRGLLSLVLVFSLGIISFISLPQQHVIAQESNSALQRGYRTGYSDGYMAGYRDLLDSRSKDFSSHGEYASADRAYNKSYGPIDEYRDGYKQGFETGYNGGFEKAEFNSEIPNGLSVRGTANESTPATPSVSTTANPVSTEATAPTTNEPTQAADPNKTVSDNAPTTTAVTTQPITINTNDGAIVIAKDTELILELQNELSTDKSRPGDRFTAKVVSPRELSDAIIEGRIDKITKPGRIKRRSELSMSFDRIIINENRWGNFAGTLTEVLPVKGDNVHRVDDEGTAVGKSTVKPDLIKVGAATGTGATVGAITGGPVGAAVGAGVGAAFGVGAVVIDRGKDIRLNVNQQLRVKSAYDTHIR
jgi:hypothetical protein